MRRLWLSLGALAMLGTTPALAQSDDPMALQRCVWACLANPTGNEDPAYHACVAQRCTAETEAEGAQSAGTPRAATDPATIAFVQQSLAALGYDPVPVDGVVGRKTAEAVQAFRASRGLAGGTDIDQNLVSALQAAGQN